VCILGSRHGVPIQKFAYIRPISQRTSQSPGHGSLPSGSGRVTGQFHWPGSNSAIPQSKVGYRQFHWPGSNSAIPQSKVGYLPVLLVRYPTVNYAYAVIHSAMITRHAIALLHWLYWLKLHSASSLLVGADKYLGVSQGCRQVLTSTVV